MFWSCCLFVWYLLFLCVDMCNTLLFLCLSHAYTILVFCTSTGMYSKTGSIFSPTPSWHHRLRNSSVTSLCHPRTGGKLILSLSLSVLLWFPFQNTVFMTAVNLQKTLFSYWSGSFWFGLTAKTIIGTCGALQCTFHTALTKSCKRDWFRGGLASVLASRYEIILVSAFQSHWENSHQQMAGQTFKVSLFSYSAHLFDV